MFFVKNSRSCRERKSILSVKSTLPCIRVPILQKLQVFAHVCSANTRYYPVYFLSFRRLIEDVYSLSYEFGLNSE